VIAPRNIRRTALSIPLPESLRHPERPILRARAGLLERPRRSGVTTDSAPADRARAAMAVGIAALGVAAAAGAFAWRRGAGDSLAGEVALVTGGSRGLGYLLARQLLQEGCRVVICGRDGETLERAVARLSQETGGDIVGWPCDVGNAEGVERLVSKTLTHFGRIDIVINNAGIIQVGPIETLNLADFQRTMDADYWGAVHTTLAILPHMRRRGTGRIVNITSIAAHVAVPHLASYNGPKHAKLGFSEGLATEVGRNGISVTTVVPGLMRTGSPIHADFRGQPEKEYAWFAISDILPVSAMSAERAARRIVRAIRRREARVTLTWQAKLLRMAHDLAPSAIGRALRMVNGVLPSADGRPSADPRPGPYDSARGTALRGTLPAPAEWALDRAGQKANQ
jgi:NAD(P)-dependent dehydrogenase (short-subunit alcohol dehydrogenase family)